MSHFQLAGYCEVSNGRRVQSTTPSGARATHHIYDTTLRLGAGTTPAELRIFATASKALLPDETYVDVVGGAFAAPGASVLIEADQVFAAFPGNPTEDDYEVIHLVSGCFFSKCSCLTIFCYAGRHPRSSQPPSHRPRPCPGKRRHYG